MKNAFKAIKGFFSNLPKSFWTYLIGVVYGILLGAEIIPWWLILILTPILTIVAAFQFEHRY